MPYSDAFSVSSIDQFYVRCADSMFDVKSKSDSAFQKKSSKKERLTRVLTQTDHNTQEPLDVGILSSTPDSWTIQSNRFSMACDNDANAALY